MRCGLLPEGSLDPRGSGTVLIAAQRVGRRARAIELDPHYCDVAILRWQAFAHDEAILAATGETFAQVVERRLSTLQVEQNVPEVTVTAPRRTKSPWSAINEGRDDAQAQRPRPTWQHLRRAMGSRPWRPTKPGQSGNPKGRKKGDSNLQPLSEMFSTK